MIALVSLGQFKDIAVQYLACFPEHLILGKSGHGLQGLVDGNDRSSRIDDHDPVLYGIDHLLPVDVEFIFEHEPISC